MSDLDQISRLLGNIEAKQSIGNNQLTLLANEVKDLNNKHTETLNVTAQLNSRLDIIEVELTETVVPVVKSVQQLKQRGIGVVAVIGLFGTGFGIGLTKIIKHITL